MAETSADDEQRRLELAIQRVKEDYDIESSKTDKIYEEGRGMVSAMLVVVGIVLAAGTTSVVRAESVTSILYFVGMGLLVLSIIVVFLVLYRGREWFLADPHPTYRHSKGRLMDDSITYKEILSNDYSHLDHVFGEQQLRNIILRKLITLAWLFLILGLIMIMSFIIASIIVE